VIEDNDDIRDSLGEILAGDGYTCWLAPSADAALRRLQDESLAPDVILLDWRLPGMNTETFLSLLKDRTTWARARVIVQTAAMEREIPKGLPIDGLVQKPFDVPQLLRLVRDAVSAGQSPTDNP
jgi:CheY-like chemotaxis protein